MEKEKEIIKKLRDNSELSIDDLDKLYYFNDYDTLVDIFGKEAVARNTQEITMDTICFIGDLIIDEKLPTYNLKYVYGMINYVLDKVCNLDNLIYVNDSVFFNNIKDANGLESLEYIRGHACFNKLRVSDGLENLLVIGKDASFPFLEDSSGLVCLKNIYGTSFFSSIKNINGLDNLECIGGEKRFNAIALSKLENRGKSLCLKK